MSASGAARGATRDRRSALVAATLHGLGLLLLARVPAPARPPTGPPAAPELVAIELETALPAPPDEDRPSLVGAPLPPAAGAAKVGRAPSPEARAPRAATPSEIVEEPTSPLTPETDAWSTEEADADALPYGFTLDRATGRVTRDEIRAAGRIALSDAPAAPTRPPPRRRVTGAETSEAVRRLVRDADRELGLGNPQEGRVATAVQEVGRAAGVPSGTRFTVTVRIAADGRVEDATIRGDVAGEAAWPDTLAALRAKLAEAPIPLGPDERGGATVVVQAVVLHVLASGTTDQVVMGECPKLPQVGGEAQPSFFAIGGAPYLEPPSGLCPLGDASNGTPKTIAVRTTTTTKHRWDAPPPVSSFSRPPKKKLLLTPTELVLKLIEDAERAKKKKAEPP